VFRELVLGAGNYKFKKICGPEGKEYQNPTTVDIDPDCHPDVLYDLNRNILPFPENTFDEIHMYEVLEHLGTQGDYKHFFAFFTEAARVLKPNGLFLGSVPAPGSPWVWGDPGHTRAILPETFVFLNQEEYKEQVGKTPMTDYRSIYKADLRISLLQEKNSVLFFALKNFKE
jgi:SAM-dependent methyltransferase